MNTQKQHVDIYRKVLLRKRLCSDLPPGAAYVPFLGDGDLALTCYAGRAVYGADIDSARVETARSRLPASSVLRVADCDHWPFPLAIEPFAVADFDAYTNPYLALVAFWANAAKAKRLALFGIDGLRYRIKREHILRSLPSGAESPAPGQAWRAQFNFWWIRQVLPFIARTVSPYRIIKKMSYLPGGGGMLYYGLVVQC